MIGLEFEKENKFDYFLGDIFDGIDTEEYILYFSEKEIHDIKIGDEYSDLELCNLLNNKDSYYIVFLNVQVYKKGKKKEIINTYSDFVKSDCEMIILISDAVYVEVYFKENDLKKLVLSNLEKKNIKYEYKTLNNDQRYTMHV